MSSNNEIRHLGRKDRELLKASAKRKSDKRACWEEGKEKRVI
jgi:hypothetical protein